MTASYTLGWAYLFSPSPLEGKYGKPHEIGTHGLWPGRPGYRSVFVVSGPGIRARELPEMSILEIYPRLRALLLRAGKP